MSNVTNDKLKYRVASRASRLARVQTDEAIALIKTYISEHELVFVESMGDKDKSTSLFDDKIPPDFFTRELDQLILTGEADFAVHSAKDLGLPLNPRLEVFALLEAFDKTDSLIADPKFGTSIEDLKPGTLVGTSSTIRKNEIMKVRPDLTIKSIRGTIEERIAQLDAGQFGAIIIATCALKRLGLINRATSTLPFETHPLQGHLAIVGKRGREDLRELWRAHDIRKKWGRVYLVGAGPGDPELLTLKAARLIKEADIIFNDSLANPRLLDDVSTPTHFVGKRGDTGGELQASINRLIYEAAVSGKKVVRLKGGDPMIFGRATEEMDYLEERMVEVELVPGISSAVAASAYTQIPLTEREVSSSVSLCLGYPPERIPAPNSDTLVYYMSSGTLETIIKKVKQAGRPGSTPVALIQNASLPEQRFWLKTIDELLTELGQNPDHDYGSPLLVFIGEVVRASRVSNWFESLPKIWYTGTNPDHFKTPARLIHRPLIEIERLSDYSIIDRALREIDTYDWIYFTSRYTVEIVFDRLRALELDARIFKNVRFAAVGKATAKELELRGIRPDFVPSVESSHGLISEIKAQLAHGSGLFRSGMRMCLPCSDKALPTIEKGLLEMGFTVTKIVSYSNKSITKLPQGIFVEELDEVILTSPSTAKAFFELVPNPPPSLLLRPIGDQTLTTLGELFPGRRFGKKILD